MPKKPPRRQNRTGSITWLEPSKALLRISTPDGVRSKTVRVSHRDHGGRGDAEVALGAFKEQLEAEHRPSVVTHSLGNTFDAYIVDLKRRNRRGGTTTSYAQIKARLSPELAAMDIGAIGPRDLELFYGELAERYAESTILTTHQVIKTVLNKAVDWRWLTVNPAVAATVNRPKSSGRRKLSPADVWVLILNAQTPREDDGKGDMVLAVTIALAAFTGARRAELSGLRWSDFDEEEGSIAIVRQWAVDHDGQMGVQDLKSDTGTDDEGRRVVYLTPLVVNALRRFRAHQRADLGREPTGWLLSHDGGTTPIKPQNLGAQITDHCRDLGFDGATPHSFRRLTSSELVAAGVDVAVAADRMGHTKQMMLGKYTTASRDRAIEAAAALEQRLIKQGLPLGDLFT